MAPERRHVHQGARRGRLIPEALVVPGQLPEERYGLRIPVLRREQ